MNEGTMAINAEVANMQAKDAIARGETAVDVNRTKTRVMIGAQRAAAASGGVDVNSGSALDVRKET